MQQAFRECHGLQCGFCTPGFLTTVAAYIEENPDPTEAEAREAVSGNLCRCTGYQNIVASVLRAAEIARERDRAMTTKLFGEPVQRVEDAKLVTGGAHFLDDLGHGALAAAFVRSPHAHARITDIDASGALEVDGLVAVYTYDDLAAADETEGSAVSEPLPLLIPHPSLTSPRTGYPLARDEVNHVGEAVVMVVARDRYLAEDAAERVRRHLRRAAAGRRRRQRAPGRPRGARRRARTTSPRTTWTRSATSTPRWPPRRTPCR